MHRKSMAGAGRRMSRERGFVLVTMAVAAIALIAVLGLAVDLGHIFISKNETQAYCDSAALAAALALDGTTAGVTSAKAAVTSSTNGWNFSTASVSSPTVTFATSINGPWQSNPSPAIGYSFAKVSATVPMQLYFIPVLVAQTLANVNSSATAAQVDLTSIPIGLAPYTAVSTNTTGPILVWWWGVPTICIGRSSILIAMVATPRLPTNVSIRRRVPVIRRRQRPRWSQIGEAAIAAFGAAIPTPSLNKRFLILFRFRNSP